MKRLLALTALFLIVSVADCHAQDENTGLTFTSRVESLKDLTGFYVLIEDMEPEAERRGLTRSMFQTGIELRLRQNGIKVLSREEWRADLLAPMLYARVSVLKAENFNAYVYFITLGVSQHAMLITNPGFCQSVTYSTHGYIGIAGELVVREAVRNALFDQVDMFLNDWYSVNQ